MSKRTSAQKRKSNRQSSNNDSTAESVGSEENFVSEPEDKRTKVGNEIITQDEDESSGDKNHTSIIETIRDEVPSTPPSQTKHGKKHGKDPDQTVNIAVSSRALFDIDDEHKIFLEKGLDEYIKLQVNKENAILKPGSAFPFIKIKDELMCVFPYCTRLLKKLDYVRSPFIIRLSAYFEALENVNEALRKKNPSEEELFTVTLMSRNSAQVGIRLQKSIDPYEGLKIQRMALTGGTSPVEYLKAFKITLFLTREEKDVEDAIKRGFPSAVMSAQVINQLSETQLRVAFDLDAVLFSDESERIYKESGLDTFLEHEKKNRDKPLQDGPLKPFAMALGKMQKKFGRCKDVECPIRTFLVTSRDSEVGERALKTLRHWGLEIDESFFMAGAPKDDILVAINPHIFFDDQKSHIDGARKSGTPSGHVPNTTVQRYSKTEQNSVATDLFK